MGEQTQSQTQTQSESSLTTTTTTTTTAAAATTTTTTTPEVTPVPAVTSTTSKIPFRPRKIRKLSSTSSIPHNNSATTTTNNNKNQIVLKQARIPPRTIARSLSCEGEIEIAIRHLKSSDPLLSRVIDLHQPPVFDSSNPPFLALSKSILYQQLAFKAGTSIYTRFVSLCGGEASVVPETVLALTAHELRQIGVSARKASYLHDLANKYCTGILSDDAIVEMDDKSLLTMLNMVKGIGSWSVHMFLIFSLHRPDVLPVGDLGVRKGVQLLYGLEELPRPSQMEQLCEKWRPYRTAASWYMWRLVEAKGAPAIEVATSQQQGQVQPQPQPQLVDPINSITNLGSCAWSQ